MISFHLGSFWFLMTCVNQFLCYRLWDHYFWLFLATAHVNQTCNCGPFLNQTRIIRLPLQYGPTSVSRLLKKVIQALVDSAINQAQVFHNIVTANGNNSNNIITGKNFLLSFHNGQLCKARVSNQLYVALYWSYCYSPWYGINIG